MNGRDLLLLLLAGKDEAEPPLDPVRLQKGAFIVCQEAGEYVGQPFDFLPLDFGPCAPGLYRVLDALVAEGLVRAQPVDGRSWKQYSLTPLGRRAAAAVDGDEKGMDYIWTVRRWLSRQSFMSLLRAVYQRYPAYAVKSVVTELAPTR